MNDNKMLPAFLVIAGLIVAGIFIFNRINADTTATTSPIPTPAPTTDVTVGEDDADDSTMIVSDTSATIALAPVDTEFAQSGTTLLEETEDGVIVTINVTGYTTNLEQPAHIHTGTCPTPGEIVYPLEDIVAGVSTTTLIDVTLEQLNDELPLAINVHKSDAESNVYTACGDVTF